MNLTQLVNLVRYILLGCPETEDADKIKGISDREEGTSLGYFKMPLHYPRYKKSDYEEMEEWRLDNLLQQYGLAFHGSLEEKRGYAIGAFLWPDQL